MASKSLLKDQSEDQSMQQLVSIAVKNIASNDMKILEVKSYSINDKLSKKLKKLSFKAYTLEEIDVFDLDSRSKPGYLSLNNGQLDVPLANLKLDNDGPWYHTDKEKAIDQVTRMNEVEWEAVKEYMEEAILSEEYLKSLVKNDRF